MSDDIKEIRKRNLRKIIDEQFAGSVNAFAKHIKRPPGFFYDAFADKRPLGERVMRSIEAENAEKEKREREKSRNHK